MRGPRRSLLDPTHSSYQTGSTGQGKWEPAAAKSVLRWGTMPGPTAGVPHLRITAGRRGRMQSALTIAALGLFLGRAPAADSPPDPVPDPLSQKEAEKEIRKVFQEEYARPAKADRAALAKKLFEQA